MTKLLPLLLLAACGGDKDDAATPADPTPTTTTTTTTTTVTTDTQATDTGTPRSEPGELTVGYAETRMLIPVGIGTAGFSPLGVPADPTPFSSYLFPGTTGIHGHPDMRAVAVSRGPDHTLVFLRVDMIGVFSQLRRAVLNELEERTGRDMHDQLVIGATHTHAGPGRVVDLGGPFELITDTFFPEHYERMVDAMADTVEGALNDMQPGRVGTAFANGEGSINDRRCEDGLDYVNGTLPVVAIEQGGELRAVMMAYAIHGTIHGIDELLLSQDVSGGIEHATSDRLGVPVMMFNSWGADMSPGDPAVPTQPGAVLPGGSERIASIGQAVAGDVESVMVELEWTTDPDLWARTMTTPLNREVIGYSDGEFEYEYGAVYCTAEGDCDPTTVEDGLDGRCLAFEEEFPAPSQTEFTVGQLGGLHFVTFPGEPGTILAERVMDGIGQWTTDPVMFIGYSQDYMGYSILEEDWWQGGYEASGTLWGPKQGEYLADEAIKVYGEAVGELPPTTDRPADLAAFDEPTYDPRVADTPVGLGTVVTPPAPKVAGTDMVTVTVAGTDPWLGAPIATLQSADGTPVLRGNGQAWTSDDPLFRVHLAVDPPYTYAQEPTARSFFWTFSFPAAHPVVGAGPTLSGSYRLEVAFPDGTTTATDAFTVSP